MNKSLLALPLLASSLWAQVGTSETVTLPSTSAWGRESVKSVGSASIAANDRPSIRIFA